MFLKPNKRHMAKRFTDTEKWKKPFIRGLTPELKLLWFYILDDCDISGLWQKDLEIAEIRAGVKFNEAEIMKAFEDQIILIDAGEKWFIPSFLEFQYGSQLSKANNIFKSIDKILTKHNLYQYLQIEITDLGTTISAYRGRISQRLKDQILLDAEFVCQYCSEQKPKKELVVDHFFPLKKGGDNSDDNLVCACLRCNSHKSDILPDVFLAMSHQFLKPTEKIKNILNTYIKKLKGAIKPLLGPKDKDRDKDMVKDKDKVVESKQILFIDFWTLYDKKIGKKGELELKWNSLSASDRAAIMAHIPNYIIAQPNKKFRKNPATFLNDRAWDDELIFETKKQQELPIGPPISIEELYIKFKNLKPIANKIRVDHFNCLVSKGMVPDSLIRFAKKKRANQLSGSNKGEDLRLMEAYNTGKDSIETEMDKTNLRIICVLEVFRNLKETGAEAVFNGN